jgi:hypothetical protein
MGVLVLVGEACGVLVGEGCGVLVAEDRSVGLGSGGDDLSTAPGLALPLACTAAVGVIGLEGADALPPSQATTIGLISIRQTSTKVERLMINVHSPQWLLSQAE